MYERKKQSIEKWADVSRYAVSSGKNLNPLLGEQSSVESNEELKRLQSEFNKQLVMVEQKKKVMQNSLKENNSDSIKIVNNFEFEHEHLDELPETHSQEVKSEESVKVQDDKSNVLIDNHEFGQPEARQQMVNQEIIELDKQMEVYQLVSLVTANLLEEEVTQFTQELASNPDRFGYIIDNMQVIHQKGIQTSLHYINDYIVLFFNFLLENHSEMLINNLSVPYGFAPDKRLKLIHGYDEFMATSTESIHDTETYDHSYQTQPPNLAFVMDEGLFLQFEQFRLQQSDQSQEYGIKELEHIHNKVIFDACNEALNFFRPFYFCTPKTIHIH